MLSVSEQLDEAHNENYSKELKIFSDEIIADLQKADTTGTGRVTKKNFFIFFIKASSNATTNIPLFKHFIQNVDQNTDANIDLNEFYKKYIQAHEELK